MILGNNYNFMIRIKIVLKHELGPYVAQSLEGEANVQIDSCTSA